MKEDKEFTSISARRIQMTGEVYIMCSECGGRVGSDDALPNETEDRIIKCPCMRMGKCEYDAPRRRP